MGLLKKAKVAVFGYPKNIMEGAAKWQVSPEEYAQAVIPKKTADRLGLKPGQLLFHAGDLVRDGDDDPNTLTIISAGGEGESFGSVEGAIGAQRDRLTRHRGSVASAIHSIFDLLNR